MGFVLKVFFGENFSPVGAGDRPGVWSLEAPIAPCEAIPPLKQPPGLGSGFRGAGRAVVWGEGGGGVGQAPRREARTLRKLTANPTLLRRRTRTTAGVSDMNVLCRVRYAPCEGAPPRGAGPGTRVGGKAQLKRISKQTHNMRQRGNIIRSRIFFYKNTANDLIRVQNIITHS